MKIACIGSGNMATFLTLGWQKKGHTIVQIISNTLQHAQELAAQVDCQASNRLTDLVDDADVYVLAMNDNAVKAFGETKKLQNKIVLHTAGSISLQELAHVSEQVGCLWCLYSIQKHNLPTRTNIPVFINATTDTALSVAQTLAQNISSEVYTISDTEKLALHVSAVLVNNYTNHLLAIAEKIIVEHGLTVKYVLPIVEQTVEKMHQHSAADNQTGPALRNDTAILEKHIQFLQPHPEWQSLYQAMATSIQKMHHTGAE